MRFSLRAVRFNIFIYLTHNNAEPVLKNSSVQFLNNTMFYLLCVISVIPFGEKFRKLQIEAGQWEGEHEYEIV